MEKKPKINPYIAEFSNACELSAKELITCGFELETQETEGYKSGDEDENIDHDSFFAAVHEETLEYCSDLYLVYHEKLSETDFLSKLDREQFKSVMKALEWDFETLCEKMGHDADEIKDEIKDSIEQNMDLGEFYFNNIDMIPCPNNMYIKTDQSVDGFEFITEGAPTYSEFLICANDVFKLDHEIDVNCSFHIHLVVKGVIHSWGSLLARRLTEYIIDHQHELPEGVRERFAACNKFYRPNLTPGEKFSFVHCHPIYKTWEFRCFGNVESASEAKICLDMAIRAMQFAYRCKVQNLPYPGDAVDDKQWEILAKQAMQNNESITDKLIKIKSNAA